MKRNYLLTVITSLALFISLVSFTPSQGLVEDILTQTNNLRKTKGLPVLAIHDGLNAIAQQHSDEMASGKMAFGHGGFNDREKQAQSKINDFKAFAENVAYGATTATEVVTMWKNSPGHRRNMLGHYRYIGIGIAKDNQGNIYYTEVFVD
jgi:uncharacterized protein YkwD